MRKIYNKMQNRSALYNNEKDAVTALNENHQRTLEQYLSDREREELIEEITQRVLSRLSITLDAAKAIQEIEDLKVQLESVFSILMKGGF